MLILKKFKSIKVLSIFAFVAICFAMLFCAFNFSASKKLQAYDENYEACILDENLDVVDNFELFRDAVNSNLLQDGYSVKVLKSQIDINEQISVFSSFSIICDEPVTFNIENLPVPVFDIFSHIDLRIIGNITFDGGNSQNDCFLECAENSSVELDGLTVENFENFINNYGNVTIKNSEIKNNSVNILIQNNGELSLENTQIKNNNAKTLIENSDEAIMQNVNITDNNTCFIISNDGTLEISGGTIINNIAVLDGDDSTYMFEQFGLDLNEQTYSLILSSTDFVISDDVNVDVIVFLYRDGGYDGKIIRQNAPQNSDASNKVQIVAVYENNEYILNDLLVQTDASDDISYSLIGVPKINGKVDAYHISLEDDGYVVRGAMFDVEYYINSASGYETFTDGILPAYFEYGSNVLIPAVEKDDYSFIGWFGYNLDTGNYFDNQGTEYSSIFDNALNQSKSISSIPNSLSTKFTIYPNPVVAQNETYFGKVYLYSKWSVNFTIVVETENENGDYEQTLQGNIIKINNETLQTSSISKNLFVGKNVNLSTKAINGYVFVGWFTKDNETYTKYGFDNYVFNTNGNVDFNIENLQFGLATLYARFAYNSSAISLQKVFIDEQNSTRGYGILSGDQNLKDAKLISGGDEYEGLEYINFVDSQILLKNGDILELQLNPDFGYKLFESNPVNIQSLTSESEFVASYELVGNKYYLILTNNGESGIFKITLNFQKNYNLATLVYGTNPDKDNLEGADANFAESVEYDGYTLYPMFDIKPTITSKTGNAYFGTDIVVMFNTRPGYRVETYGTVIKYKSLVDQEVLFEYIGEQNSEVGIKIFNVIDEIDISLLFSKIYTITLSTNEIEIDGGESIEIGRVFFGDDKSTRIIREGEAIEFQTEQIARNEDYCFKKWVIKTLDGNIANYDILKIKEEDLLQKSVSLSNIYADLLIEAVYGKKVFNVDIICSNNNGKIEAIAGQTGEGSFWQVEYGDSITFQFTPKSEMYFFKLNSITDPNYEKTESSVCVTLKLSNIVQNHRVEIDFAPYTVYENINIEELFEGDGTHESPYLIKSANQLVLVSYFVNNNIEPEEGKKAYRHAHYKLEINVEFSDRYFFVPIGNQENPFNGLFDYNYCSVSNIVLEKSNSSVQDNGLFGVMDGNAKVIRQYRSKVPIIIGIAAIGVIALVAFAIVYKIEKKRQKPKKVFVLDVSDRENNDWQRVVKIRKKT